MISTDDNSSDSVELTNERIASGEDCFKRGDTDGAIKEFNHVLELDPENIRANSNVGVVLWQTGDRENALIYLNRAHNTDPDDKVVLTNLAEVYLALKQEQEALRLYKDYLERHPEDDEIQCILNTLDLEQSADVKCDLEYQLLRCAEELQARHKINDAVTVLDAVLVLSGEQLEAHRKMGELYQCLNQKGKAIEHLMKAFRLDSFDSKTTLQLSELFCERGSFEAAVHVCSTYLLLVPDDQEITDLLEKCQDLDAAEKISAAGEKARASESAVADEKSFIARIPEMDSVLNALSVLGVEVKSILDIGVLHGTPPLMRKFPDLKHYLFEPIDDHFDVIRRNYSKFTYQLFHVALSSTDGEAWQNSLCNDGSGRITHSQIADKPCTPGEDPRFVKAQRVRMAQLDTLMEGMDVETPYLLKLDVDGHEIPVLEGSRETLKNAAVVVIEATADSFLDRANFLAEEGFVLFDIVDFAYYSGVLHQVDIVFIRKEFLGNNDRLRPMHKHAFKLSHWHQVSADRFLK